MAFKIGNKLIGNSEKIFFIAEAGVNHNGSVDYGMKLIDIAVKAGADAVKFQTFKAESLNTLNAPKSTYHVETTGTDEDQSWFDLLKSQEISVDMHKKLINYCNQKKIIFLSTPYDEESADLLDNLNVAAFKIASTDTNNLRFLDYVARKKRPMIISTAMCSIDEVTEAVDTIKSAGLKELVVLQCTGNYPSKIEDSNLSVINKYKELYKIPVGYSDHTMESINPILAVGLGISVYEKHYTIDRNMPGPDHRMSLDPEELINTISILRKAEKSIGNNNKKILEDEIENRNKLRKSIVARENISKGQVIDNSMLIMKRPGTGIQPRDVKLIVGSKAKQNINRDELINSNMLDLKK